jgi:hypothetical protein
VGVVSVPFKTTSSDLNRVSYGYFGWFGLYHSKKSSVFVEEMPVK